MTTVRDSVMFCLLLLGAVQSCPYPSLLRRTGGSSLCARLYQHDVCGGRYRIAYRGSYNQNVGEYWNDEISSLVVLPGCNLQVFEHDKFKGARAVFGYYSRYGKVVSNIGNYWNDKITSYICTCR